MTLASACLLSERASRGAKGHLPSPRQLWSLLLRRCRFQFVPALHAT
jgi:hypothetical protein